MANVKITELVELAAADVAAADVFPIVDTSADATKKVTIASLRTTVASANDFVTYTLLNANVNTVQGNVAAALAAIDVVQDNVATESTAIEARRVANIAGAVSTITTGNLTASKALVSDGSGKVAVSAVTSTELGYVDGVTSAIQTQIDTKIATTDSASNDFITYTQLDANINIVSANAIAVEARRVANIAGAVSTITTADLTASRALVSDGSGKVAALASVTSTELGYVDATSSIQTQLDTKIATTASASNDFITYTQLNANINLVQDNVVAASGAADVEVRRVANIQGAVSTITTADLTASKALVSDGSGKVAVLASVTSTELAFLDATSSVQTQLDTKIATTASASNDFVTYTRLDANINVVSANTAAVETKRVANIQGAISTITTADLTASRAVVSDGSGKLAVSDITATEIGYLDGVSSAIQTQLNTKAPLASPTFSGVVTAGHDLVVTGNLTVNGDTTTVNSENKIIQDRFIMLANAVSGAPSADVGIFFNRGNEGNAAIFYDESAKFFTLSETRDPDSNVVISPTGAANLAVGQFTATSVKYNGADLNTAITDNRSGAVSTVYKDNLTASRAVVSDGSGKVAVSDVTSTEIGYLDGVSSAIQTQLDSKAALAGATFSGTIQLNSTFVQGTDDQGYDFKLFGDTSGAFLLWDTSADTLGVTGAAKIDITKDKLLIGGTAVTTTAAEVNLLDAITRGSIIYGNASGASARLAVGGADKVLTTDGTDISWEDPAGGGAMGFTTATTIADPPGTVNTDLGNLTDTMFDDFGISQQPSYDLMEAHGRTVSLDLGAL